MSSRLFRLFLAACSHVYCVSYRVAEPTLSSPPTLPSRAPCPRASCSPRLINAIQYLPMHAVALPHPLTSHNPDKPIPAAC